MSAWACGRLARQGFQGLAPPSPMSTSVPLARVSTSTHPLVSCPLHHPRAPEKVVRPLLSDAWGGSCCSPSASGAHPGVSSFQAD